MTKLINPSKEQVFNLVYNSYRDFSHIKDSYLRQKLEHGYIQYEPELWAISQLEPREERALGGR